MSDRPATSTQLRLEIVDVSAEMVRLGLNRGTAGNVSVRWDDGFLVTPSGLPPSAIHPDDVVAMDMEGVARGRAVPSSEWRLHRDAYAARPEINAVVHCHPPFCVALAVLRRDIPPYHYMIAKAGGTDIRCSAYATYGTQALSDAAMTALTGRRACLLANHGMLALGTSLKEALALAVEVEELAEGYWRALQIGDPVLLTAGEMAEVLEKFKTYGSAAQTARRI